MLLMQKVITMLTRELILEADTYCAEHQINQEAGGSIMGFDGTSPSLSKTSLIIAGNTPESCKRVLDIVHLHLPRLPY